MSKIIPAVRGTHDIMPTRSAVWRHIEDRSANCFASYGYGEVRTPVLEQLELFCRPVGEDSDIVQKELFRIPSSEGKDLCLRPEATVPTMRSLLAAGLVHNRPAKVWYCGPMFRRERPQRGRYRQFHQLGAEAVGYSSAVIDAELILLSARLWKDLGIDRKVRLELNNLGSATERAAYRAKLSSYLQARRDELDEAARARITSNPLRILDTKDEKTLAVVAEAPLLTSHLGAASRRHYDQVGSILTRAGLPFSLNERLVRGLDYYNLTVFEWFPIADDLRRQSALAGGGRYDGLAELIGGGSSGNAGCGFAAGMERIVDLLGPQPPGHLDVYLGTVADDATWPAGLQACEQLRDSGFGVDFDPRGGKGKIVFKRAKDSGAKVAVLIDPAAATALIKPLRFRGLGNTVQMPELASQVSAILAAQGDANHGT